VRPFGLVRGDGEKWEGVRLFGPKGSVDMRRENTHKYRYSLLSLSSTLSESKGPVVRSLSFPHIQNKAKIQNVSRSCCFHHVSTIGGPCGRIRPTRSEPCHSFRPSPPAVIQRLGITNSGTRIHPWRNDPVGCHCLDRSTGLGVHTRWGLERGR